MSYKGIVPCGPVARYDHDIPDEVYTVVYNYAVIALVRCIKKINNWGINNE